jgi:hypothetical protein
MKRLLLILVLCLLPSLAGATTYFADPAGGGAASCVDSGANVCTLTRALTVAATGDTITAACGTYSQGATTVTVSKNITLSAVTSLCAIITGTNATAIVTLTASNDANVLTFSGFEIQNTGGATSSGVSITNVAYDASVTFTGNLISVGGTNRHLVDAYTRGTVRITNNTFTGTVGAQECIHALVTPSSAKKLVVTGNTFTLTYSASSNASIHVERAAGNAVSFFAYVANNTITATMPTGLGNAMTTIGIRLKRITMGTDLNGVTTPPIVENNTISMTATAVTAADVYAILADSTDATALGDGVVIRNNVATCNAPSTRCIAIGNDGVTANNVSNAQVTGNRVYGPFYDGSATPHGLSIGRTVNAYVWGNTVTGFAAGILVSMGTTHVVTGNLIIGATYAPLFAKANTSATISNNTVIMDDALYGVVFGGFKACMSVSVQGATNNAATTFQNNNCYVRSGTGWSYAVVANSQVANFDHNNAWSLVTLTTPWSYQSTTYATVSLWNAAATVGTDTNVDPVFVDPATDYRLANTSTLRGAGLFWGAACADVRGRRCFMPVDVGGYQTGGGDPASDRTARN